MKKQVQEFFKHHWKGGPLLLALSGGPDSLSLFFLLEELDIPFHVAHVDHRWRPESGKEAEALQTLCQKKHYPFYLKVLDPKKVKGNLEDGARNLRRAFFRELVHKEGFEAVLLGHHADDQAETVLKRVFEGARLHRLSGLKPVATVEHVALWRPLLEITKRELLSYLEGKERRPFADSTNEDPRFLRARMRHSLLPLLSEHFGKEIQTSLCRLGKTAGEFHLFLEELLAPYHQAVVREEGSLSLDLSPFTINTLFEWKAVVGAFFDQEGITLSSPVCEAIVAHLKKRSAHKVMVIGKNRLLIDRGSLYLELNHSLKRKPQMRYDKTLR